MRTLVSSIAMCTVVGSLLGAPAVAADNLNIAMPAPGENAAPPVNSGKVALTAGTDFYTHYFFRGILQENQGLIAQPYVNVGFKLYEGDGPINSVTLNIGTWSSFHFGSPTGDEDATSDPTNPEGFSGDPKLWYEADLYAGVSIGLFDNFTLGFVYTAYTSPNNSFATIQDATISLAYADGGLWNSLGLKNFALNPSASVIIETHNQADSGNSLTRFGPSPNPTSTEEGVYLQLGIAPSFVICESATMPIKLTIPMTVGLSLSDYYEFDTNGDGTAEDETFGFFDAGLVLSAPIAFIPADFGAWEARAGVHFLFLGDTTEFANNGDDFEVIGQFSIGMTY